MTVWDKIYGVLVGSLKTGGYTKIIKVSGAQIGVDAATYASGDVLGDKSPIEVEFVRSNNGTGVIQSLITKDLSAQSGAYDVFVFDSLPTGTYTDNAAFDLTDADTDKCLGVISVSASDYAASADSTIATSKNIGLTVQNASGSNKLWLIYVSRDAKTYVADELSNAFGVFQD